MKKLNRLSAIIALILIAAFILPSTAVIAAANDSNLVYFYGDLNANGEIDEFDYLLVKRGFMATLELDPDTFLRGDVNGNGELDIYDYLLVKRHVMGTYTIPMVTLCEHEIESIKAKDATCDENGNIAYFYCVKCEKCYSDAEATNEITPESTVSAAKGHDYTELKNDETAHWKECACGEKSEVIAHTYTDVVTPPTESEQGFTTHTCNECGHSYKDSYVKPTASVGLSYTGNDDGITCTVTGIGTCSDSDLIIPSKINGYKVTLIGDKAFRNCTSLTSVTIGNSVTSIGDSAFENCTGLTSITIPDGVTSIGYRAFCYCRNLTSITIPDNVTSIGSSAFGGCPLEDIYYQGDIEDWLSIDFYDVGSNPCCNGANLYFNDVLVTELVIPDGVISIGNYAFDSCTSLTSITIPDSVTSIGERAFYECSALTSIAIPDSVTSIGDYAFCGCTSLTSITILDSVTSIGYGAFQGCTSLTSITIPDSVTSIDNWAFAYCDNLTSVTIGNNVTSIDHYAFRECTSLTSVTIGNSVTSIGDEAFAYCSNLKDVYYAGSQEEWKQIKIGSSNSRLTSATIHYNHKIASSGLSYDVNEDGITCTITGIGDCSDTHLVIPSEINGYNVTSIGDYAFEGCTSLTSVTIGNSVTSIGNSAFGWCKALTSIVLTDSVTSIDYSAFYYCTSLTSINIPDSVTSIGDYALYGCSNLEDVYYAGSQEEWDQIEIGAYNYNLTSATIHYNSK